MALHMNAKAAVCIVQPPPFSKSKVMESSAGPSCAFTVQGAMVMQ